MMAPLRRGDPRADRLGVPYGSLAAKSGIPAVTGNVIESRVRAVEALTVGVLPVLPGYNAPGTPWGTYGTREA